MKTHEIADVVNAIVRVRMEFHASQQLEDRMTSIVVPVLKAAQSEIERLTVELEIANALVRARLVNSAIPT